MRNSLRYCSNVQAMHATSSHSSGSSPPRAPGTFYHNPFAIDSPFKQLRMHPLSSQHGLARDPARVFSRMQVLDIAILL